MENQRLIDIEIKLSHQEALLEELHQVLYRQQATIDGLEKTLKILVKKEEDESKSKALGLGNQKPPHY
jgi:SlyX protein